MTLPCADNHNPKTDITKTLHCTNFAGEISAAEKRCAAKQSIGSERTEKSRQRPVSRDCCWKVTNGSDWNIDAQGVLSVDMETCGDCRGELRFMDFVISANPFL